ncbi:MAG TPA: ribonuclease P protein component [Candidatus Paceibacterota bacterium]
MLPKTRRIPRNLWPSSRPGKVYKGQLSSLYVFEGKGHTRFAVSISKKTAKRAVDRNRIRRWGYRALSEFMLKIKPGFLFKLSFYNVPIEYKEVEQEVKTLLLKSHDILL